MPDALPEARLAELEHLADWGDDLDSVELEEIVALIAEVRRLRAAVAGMNAVCDHQTDRRGGKEPEAGALGIRPRFHPLTCGNDSRHTPLYPYWTGKHIVLLCRDCGYTQDNAAMFFRPSRSEGE